MQPPRTYPYSMTNPFNPDTADWRGLERMEPVEQSMRNEDAWRVCVIQ